MPDNAMLQLYWKFGNLKWNIYSVNMLMTSHVINYVIDDIFGIKMRFWLTYRVNKLIMPTWNTTQDNAMLKLS